MSPSARRRAAAGQLGFDGLLADADRENRQAREAAEAERVAGHLPGTMAEAVPHYRSLIRLFDAAVRRGDLPAAEAARDDAYRMARKVNGGAPGILAGEDAPGCALERETAAADGAEPLWGQRGRFTVPAHNAVAEIDGMFGLGMMMAPVPGFSVTAVDRSAKFLSDTGFRSFLGIAEAIPPGCGPLAFVGIVLDSHVRQELRGRLKTIRPLTVYRPRGEAR